MERHSDRLRLNPMDNKLFGARAGEMSAALSLNFFMVVVVIFFLGILLASPSKSHLRIPILYLFISFFGFVYSTLIYTNASDRDARLQTKEFTRHIFVGNILSEYLGVYFLVFATPMAILTYSSDKILAILVCIVCIIGFMAYHFFGFSVLQRYIRNSVEFISSILVMIILMCTSFIFHANKQDIFYYFSCFFLLVIVFFILIRSIHTWKQMFNNQK